MRRFIFEQLLMLSTPERKGRKIRFGPRITVIKGANDTGKSSLIKTLYQTFGASPPNFHPNWIAASVKSAIRFRVDDTRFTILRDSQRYTLFDSDSARIGTYTSITHELGPALARLFAFHLRLPLRTGDHDAQATPAFLFLPFYIDQDRGWNDQRASFTKLQQFGRSWAKDAMEYHTGIRPNEFYAAKGRLLDAQNTQKPFLGKREVLNSVLQDLRRQLASAEFDVSIEAYAREIESLLEKSGSLRDEEEHLKERLVSLYNARSVLSAQVSIASHAAQELARDFDYAADTALEATVECPTCGASYENSFRERYAIAEDEDSCQQLVLDLKEELGAIEERLRCARAAHTNKSAALQEVEKLLESRRGSVTLRDILENEGKKEVRGIIGRDIEELNTEIGRLDGIMRQSKGEMERLTNRIRRTEIVAQYRRALERNLLQLDVQPQPPSAYKRVDALIRETGSDLPRALLAYYFALLEVIGARSTSTFCPIVIDSPNQQDQDPTNLRRIFEFIRNAQPAGSQLVLGLVDPQSIEFGGSTVTLVDKYSVLRREEYGDVADEVRPLIDASMRE